MSTTYKRQSRKAKPVPVDQAIAQFERLMNELGFEVSVDWGSGIYIPRVMVSAWDKRDQKGEDSHDRV